MKRILLTMGILILSFGCNSGQDTDASDASQKGIHKVVVLETMNTSSYTYLRVKESGKEKWLALPLMLAKVGDIYYYANEMAMPNFKSKELNRTFETIYFIEGVSTDPAVPVKVPAEHSGNEPMEAMPDHPPMNENDPHSGSAGVVIEKKEVKIKAAKEVVSIANLFSKKESYAGKKITVSGQVTKFNSGIMNRNWVHIQDGSDFNGKFDLVITTNDDVRIDEVVTFEGKIAINKDFGAGYFYEVVMEDASLRQR